LRWIKKFISLSYILLNMKITIILTLALFLVPLVATVDVPIGDCEIELDFEDKNITATASDTRLSGDVIYDTTDLIEESTMTTGSIAIYDLPFEAPVSALEGALKAGMDAICGRVSIEPHGDGFIATGLFREGGQKTWGVNFPINNVDGKTNRTITIIASFEDEDFNERLVFCNISFKSYNMPYL